MDDADPQIPRTVKNALLRANIDIDDDETYDKFVLCLIWLWGRYNWATQFHAIRARSVIGLVALVASSAVAALMQWLFQRWSQS